MIRLKQSETFRRWHRRLKDRKAKIAVAARLQRLQAGNPGDTQPVGDGISELRIHVGPGYRIYYQRRSDVVVLLLCGGDKSTQERDIKAARLIAAQWSEDG